MNTELQLRDAKATLSSVVDHAVAGDATIITRHGRREAVVVGYETWLRLTNVPSFGQLLGAAPLTDDDLPERGTGGLRDPDL